MRVRSKILIPPIILTVLAAGAILVSNVFQFSGYVDETSEASVDIAAAVAQKNLDSYFIESQTAAMYVAGDRGISAAMAILDRDALISRASGLLSSISPDFCTISDASGTVVARTHDPDEFGDSIANQKNIQAAIAGNSYSGLEQGAIVGLSVRASARVLDAGGEFIGIVSIGFRLDTDTFVDELKDITHCEATVFLGDTRISTTVLNADGTRAIGVKASDAYRDTVLGGVRFIGKTDVVGRNALASYSPIMNNEGETIGILSVAHYIDNSTATIMAFVQSGMLIMILMLALTVGVLLFVAKAISNPLRSMVSSATAVAGGDLTRQVEVATRDEVRELGDAFNDMVAKNHDVFLKIRASANSVANGSQQIASSSQALAQGATQQAAAVQELSSSMSDISDRTKSNVQIAEQAAKLAEAVKDSANRGSAQMDEMMAAVKQIHDASQSISKVINTIDDIAFQTNILALNAAVEAARAGTHGKGFAVVAEEVRNLAAKSAEAASDTESLIANSMQKAELGVRIASETSESLMEIVNGINESNELVLEIARSSEQQSGEISQINTGIEQVAQVVQHNSATAEESAAAADEMKGQSAVLQHLVSQFKLDEGQSALPSASDYEDDLLLAPYDDRLAM